MLIFNLCYCSIITIENTEEDLGLMLRSKGETLATYFTKNHKRLKLQFDYDEKCELCRFEQDDKNFIYLSDFNETGEITTFDDSTESERNYNLNDCDEIVIPYEKTHRTSFKIEEDVSKGAISIEEAGNNTLISTISSRGRSSPLKLRDIKEWSIFYDKTRKTYFSFKENTGPVTYTSEYLFLTLRFEGSPMT